MLKTAAILEKNENRAHARLTINWKMNLSFMDKGKKDEVRFESVKVLC